MHAPDVDLESMAAAVLRRTEAFVVLVTPAGHIVAVNDALAAATCRMPGDLMNVDVEALIIPRDAPKFRRALLVVSRGGSLLPQEYGVLTREGEPFLSVAWAISGTEDLNTLACVGVDVTATRDEVEVLRSRAMTDALTGLPNRAGLLEQLAGWKGTGATVAFCDLNGFKAVNDTLGHPAGDAVLVQVARRLRRTVRGEDFVARIGGDEFVIVAPPDPSANFDILGRRLLRAMDQPILLPGGLTATVGMSIGEAVLEPGAEIETVLYKADRNMYRMKSRQPTRAMAAARDA